MSTQRASLLFIALCFSSSAIYADSLSPISVTASRSPISSKQAPSAITVITRGDIEKTNTVYAHEILQSVPGLNVSTQGSTGSLTQVRIRGAEANQTLVIIDGIEVNDPATGSAFDFAHLAANNIDKIEIIRGPQSALWGSDALAGVISITTRSANNKNQLIANSSYGSENSYQGSVSLLSGSEKFNFALNGNFIDTDGINSATSGSERDGYDNSTINMKSNITINNSLNAGITARYTNASNEFDPAPIGLPIDGFGKTDVEQIYLRGFIELSTFDDQWVHKFDASKVDTSNDSKDELFGNSESEGTKEKFSFQSTAYLPELKNLGLNQTITVAIEREQERFSQQGASFPGFDPNQKQKITHYGKVLEYRASLLDAWLLSVAVRDDNNDQFDDQKTYRVGVNYIHPHTKTRVYAAHGTGVKNPSFTELFGFAPNNFIGNPDLEAETSESWEIGLSHDFLNDTLTLQASLFWEHLKDEIQTIFLPTFQSTVINNQSRSERNGLELSFHNQTTESFSISGNYTYLDATEPDVLGNNRTEIRRPRHQWSTYMTYTFPDEKTDVNVTMNYIGDRRDIDFSMGNRLTLDSYTLINLAINYQLNDSIKLFGRINNLLDEEYQDVFGFETNEFSGFIGAELIL